MRAKRALILNQFTPYRIVALGHALSGALSRAYADENITIPEWRVLAVIAQEESIAARDVVRLTPMDKMKVSRAISSLESKSLAQRRVNANDRRVNEISLTQSGRSLFDRISTLALEFESTLLDGFSTEECKTLDRLLAKLGARAGAFEV